MRNVFASWPVATLTPNIPFCDLLRVYVVVNRMATIAGWASWTLHVVGRVIGRPPVRSRIGDVISEPLLVANVPLRKQRIIVISDLREVALLPLAAVYESHLIDGKLRNIVSTEIRNDRVRMCLRVADHVRHRRLPPAFIDVRMALLAGFGTNIMGSTGDMLQDRRFLRCRR